MIKRHIHNFPNELYLIYMVRKYRQCNPEVSDLVDQIAGAIFVGGIILLKSVVVVIVLVVVSAVVGSFF